MSVTVIINATFTQTELQSLRHDLDVITVLVSLQISCGGVERNKAENRVNVPMIYKPDCKPQSCRRAVLTCRYISSTLPPASTCLHAEDVGSALPQFAKMKPRRCVRRDLNCQFSRSTLRFFPNGNSVTKSPQSLPYSDEVCGLAEECHDIIFTWHSTSCVLWEKVINSQIGRSCYSWFGVHQGNYFSGCGRHRICICADRKEPQ